MQGKKPHIILNFAQKSLGFELAKFCLRWGHYPIDEAQTFGHTQVVEYMKKYEDDLEAQQKIQREEEEKKNNKEKAQSSTLPI